MVSAAAARKTVSVLFCDLTGFTALGETLDPEPLRELMGSWYEAMRNALEAYGGTAEKFAGDAVMAVFGLPHAHEDDALRAVRAGLAMQEAAGDLVLRIGINTGVVVTGDELTTLVTGDAVNTAKRLEQAAASGEILVGAVTERLIRHAVELEPVTPIDAKGKSVAIEAWRVLGEVPGAEAFARRWDTPLVGRRSELGMLRDELTAAVDGRKCRLVTVVAAAGVGKTRLASELAAAVGDQATILTGRCLPYGDGITFWPLAELLRGLGGEQAIAAAVEEEPDAAFIVERLGMLTGGTGTPEELAWAVRRLFETLARSKPLVLVLEDVHWAEPMLLDFVEYLSRWSSDAPILLLCLARPELLEERPHWEGMTVRLEPLSNDEGLELLAALDTTGLLSPELRERVSETAQGNPLYAEQLVAMLAEPDGDADLSRLPPTIDALIAARLDRLEAAERDVLERAAVVGKDFWFGAMVALGDADEPLGTTLLELVRRDLVEPAPSTVPGEDGFSFRHALIRDAAYASAPLRRRAGHHERFGAWLESRDGGDAELVGYHLEQAYRCREELGEKDEALGSRAATLLGDAGHRAYTREDMAAAANLLDRAAGLAELDPARLRELGRARFRIGDVDGAMSGTAAAIALAAATGDRRQEWHARLDQASHRLFVGESSEEELAAVATEAVAVFAELEDPRGLAYAWQRLALASLRTWRFGDAVQQAERAIEHATSIDEPSETMDAADLLCTAFLYGPEPADAAEQRARELLELLPAPAARAAIESTLAVLVAMQGRFDEARALAIDAADIFDELGLRLPRAGLAELSAWVEQLAGDFGAAERERRFAFDALEAPLPAVAGIQAAQIARLTAREGRLDEATAWLGRAQALSSTTDRNGVAELGLAEVEVALVQGRDTDAEERARALHAAVADTDALQSRAEASALLAACSGKAPLEAIALYEQKGNTAAVSQLRRLVDARLPR